MKKVQITETVLRDANQSLMATRLPYSDFEAILPEMDKAGYYSVECWAAQRLTPAFAISAKIRGSACAISAD